MARSLTTRISSCESVSTMGNSAHENEISSTRSVKKSCLHQNDLRNNESDDTPAHSVFTLSCCLFLGGAVLGWALPKNSHLSSPAWQLLSNVVGYTYFLAWSLSFYPQVLLNWRRKSTQGLSVDFCVLNVVGFICYAIYTTNFYWNDNVIRAYKDRNSGKGATTDDKDESMSEGGEITVQANDVCFAIHAVIMSTITLCQVGVYDTFTERPPSRRVYFLLFATLAFCSAYVFSTWMFQGHINLLGFLYTLGAIKVGVSIGKYVPQALLNQSRKSTVGWNVWNIILDLTGGVLSLLQLVGDCADMDDWSGITGNPAKMALSLVTICFDIIFLVQHYVLYPANRWSYSPLPGIESTVTK